MSVRFGVDGQLLFSSGVSTAILLFTKVWEPKDKDKVTKPAPPSTSCFTEMTGDSYTFGDKRTNEEGSLTLTCRKMQEFMDFIWFASLNPHRYGFS
jgi:hypothetical protein